MEAGRELDALVADKVMGLKQVQMVDSYPVHVVISKNFAKIEAVPPYSTDIAVAWQVVEKMRPKFNIVLECVSFEFNCHINVPGNVEERVHARAATAPHAICLAALKALDIKV